MFHFKWKYRWIYISWWEWYSRSFLIETNLNFNCWEWSCLHVDSFSGNTKNVQRHYLRESSWMWIPEFILKRMYQTRQKFCIFIWLIHLQCSIDHCYILLTTNDKLLSRTLMLSFHDYKYRYKNKNLFIYLSNIGRVFNLPS